MQFFPILGDGRILAIPVITWSMKPGGQIIDVDNLFRHVQPRPEVLSGSLTEAIFAASLDEVVEGTAPSAYGDADFFFAATYPSGGLRTLLNEALGRLGGGKPDGASVLRLETSLGGGKTHNLIALFHAAQGRLPRARAGEFMDAGLLPSQPTRQIGVFVGTSTGATSFPERDGVSPRTVWGHLALQVGGRRATSWSGWTTRHSRRPEPQR